MKKSLLITITFLLLSTIAFAQSGKLNRANRHFEKGNYEKAIVLYSKILKKSRNAEAIKKIAWSYVKSGNEQESEYWFGQSTLIENISPDYYLYYAVVLGLNHKCDLGHSPLKEFKTVNPTDERIVQVEDFLKKACWEEKPKFDWSKIMESLKE